MAPILVALGKYLVANGLPLIANAVLAKGKEVVEERLGVKLEQGMTNEQLLTLKQREFDHQEFLMNMALQDKTLEADWMKTEQVTTTERWKADMASDSWLSKNVRPGVLVYILFTYTLFAVSSAFGVEVKQAYVELMAQWGMLIMTAYFGGRSIEKVVQMVQSRKANESSE